MNNLQKTGYYFRGATEYSIPEWYVKSLVTVDDDTLLLDWQLNEGEKSHRGYCKFCKILLYGSDLNGSVEEEYTHMVSKHPEELAIYRIGSL